MTQLSFTRRTFRQAAAALVAGMLAIPTVASASAGDDATENNERIVRDAFAAWQQGGNVFEILDPEITWVIRGSGTVAGTYRGIDDFIDRGARPLTSRLAGPLVPELHHVFAKDDRVLVRFDAAATTTAGETYENSFVWIMRFEDGAVVEAEAFLDLDAYRRVIERNEPRPE